MRKLFYLSVIVLINQSIHAQYLRETFTAPFVPITIAGGATLSTASGDGVLQTGVPIGFTFNYYSVPYTTIAVSTDGFASFTATTNSFTNTNLFTTTAPNAVLAPWWDDLTTEEILYQTTGSPGSQVFTIQWTSKSYYITSTRTIVFQVKLYEGSDIIEFQYSQAPISGVFNTSESASIGICNQTGGLGNYIDAITGSSFVNNSMMNSLKWPKVNFRFTPGVSITPISGGTINVGIAQTYSTLWQAVADINHRGITGPVILNLTDPLYDSSAVGGYNMFPVVVAQNLGNPLTFTSANNSTLAWYGSLSGNIGNGATTFAIGSTSEPIIGLVGSDNVTIENLNFVGTFSSSPNRVDRAIALINHTATDGAQNNIIQNVNVSLDRTNTSSIGIELRTATTPTASSGNNSFNIIRDFYISNTYRGILLTSTSTTFNDNNNQITTSNCTYFNVIGAPNVNDDIGNGTLSSYGIQLNNQSNFKVNNNRISNVTTSGAICNGINIVGFSGTNNFVNNNIVKNLRNNSATSTAVVSGIKTTHSTTGNNLIFIYNNSISGITSGYTGAITATRVLRGINLAGTGGNISQQYNIVHNSVNIDGSGSPNLSSVCLEVATTSGPVYNIGNNIFVNATAAQTAPAEHYVYRSTSATAIGNTGSISNYNDLYVTNDVGVSGFVAQGGTTNYNTITAWNTATSQDANSVSIDPQFVDPINDLHVGNVALNGLGTNVTVSDDLDCITRGPDSDMGAYVINVCSGTPIAGTISGPSSLCDGQAVTLSLSGNTSGAGITYQWAESSTSGGPYTNLGTTNTQNTGTLTNTTYYVVTITCTQSGLSATTPEHTLVVNPLPTVAVSPTSSLYCSGSTPVTLTASGAVSYNWTPAAGLSSTTGTSVDASPSSTTTYIVTGTDANGCTNTASALVNFGNTPSINSVTATPSAICEGDDSQLNVSANANMPQTINLYNYNYSTGGTLQNMTGATIIVNSGVDDTPSLITPIGFTFIYEGVPYTHFSASPDGFIKLGAPAASSQFSNNITSTTNIPKVYPYWDDLATGTDGYVRYLVTGTPGNQILVVEWFVTIPRNTLGGANSTFQAWLYEATGDIEFRYGNMNTASMNASVGATGATATNYQSITVSTNTSSTSTPNNLVAEQPANGTIYAFSPPNQTLSYTWFPVTYLNNPNIENPIAQAVMATTTYTVTVTNADGCTTNSNVTVNVNTPPSITVASTVSPSCVPGNDGSIDITVTGTPSFAYNWSTGATTEDVTGLSLGTYTVTVTDGNNCNSTLSYTFAVTGFNVTGVVTDATCNGDSNGQIDITVTGGTLPYNGYAWSDGSTLDDRTGLSAGTYTVVVTDNLGCTTTNSFNVNEPAPLTITSTVTDIDCFGNNNGAIDITPSGGNGGFTFNWIQLPSTPIATSEDVSGLASGIYSVTVTDGANCTATSSFTINEPAAIVINSIDNNVTCNGLNNGSIDITVTGGVTSYSYAWSNGATTEDISGLSPNTYTVTVADANNCNSTYSVTITEPAILTHTITSTNVLCFGDNSGTATVMPSGGTLPYNYLWSDGQTNSSVNLPAGIFTVTITDANGCTNSNSVTITQPLLLTANITSVNDVTCHGANNGSATAVAGYGTPNYTYAWSNGASTANATGLSGGTYTITVSDNNGCTATATVTIVEPAALNTTANVTNEIWGNDGSIDITPSGGTPPYTFSWNNGATTEDINNLSGATYTVTITDANSCTQSFTYNVLSFVGIDEHISGFGTINFYPNPSNGLLNMSVAGFTGGNLELVVLDMNGRVVFTQQLKNAPESFVQEMDLRTLNMGTYLIRLISDYGTHQARIIITRQ